MKTDKYGGKKVKKSKVKKSKKQANSNFNDNQEKSSRNLIADTSVKQSFIMSPANVMIPNFAPDMISMSSDSAENEDRSNEDVTVTQTTMYQFGASPNSNQNFVAPIYIRDSENGSGQRTDERIAGVSVSNFNQSATSITPVVKNVKVQNPDGTFTKGKLYTQSYKHLP